MALEPERRSRRRSCRRRRAAPRRGPAFSSALARVVLPSASTTSTSSRLSIVSPCLRVRWPRPPPSVRPPTPVVEMIPLGVASPNSCVARSTSPQVQPPATRTVARCGIDVDPAHRREVEHDAVVAHAETRRRCVRRRAPRAGSPCSRAKRMVRATSSVLAQRAISAGVAVDHGVEDRAGLVVAGVLRTDQGALEADELLPAGVCDGDGAHVHAPLGLGGMPTTLGRRSHATHHRAPCHDQD